MTLAAEAAPAMQWDPPIVVALKLAIVFFLVLLNGRLPKHGDTLTINDFDVTVVEADERHVRQLGFKWRDRRSAATTRQ